MKTNLWNLAIVYTVVCGCVGGKDDAPPQTEPDDTTTASTTTDQVATGETGIPDDTGTETFPEPCAPVGTGAFTGPTTIHATSVTCNAGDDNVQYLACTQGPSAGGWVFAQETGNIEPNWSDAHTLDSIGGDPLGWFEQLERRLATAANITTWATDVSTLFGCRAHFEDPAIMTYAMMVTDADGQPANCVVWGENTRALINGTIGRVNEPPFNLSACREIP